MRRETPHGFAIAAIALINVVSFRGCREPAGAQPND
jgi:hypothetical protein